MKEKVAASALGVPTKLQARGTWLAAVMYTAFPAQPASERRHTARAVSCCRDEGVSADAGTVTLKRWFPKEAK